jgi:DNA-binding NtrC family response regulator
MIYPEFDEAMITQRDVLAGPPSEEYLRIVQALQECAGNQTKAARFLGMSRRTLVNRLTMYGITRPRKNTPGT